MAREKPFTMDDLEELVYFFMNAPIDKPFSKEILVRVMCQINEVPNEDPAVRADIENWLVKTKEKLGR